MKVEYNVGKSTFCHIHLNLGKRQNLYYFLVFSCWLHDDAAPLLSDSPWSRHLLIMTCESVTWDIWHQLLWHVTIIIAETIIIYCGSVSKSTAAVILIIYMGHRKLHQKLLYQNCWCLQKSKCWEKTQIYFMTQLNVIEIKQWILRHHQVVVSWDKEHWQGENVNIFINPHL